MFRSEKARFMSVLTVGFLICMAACYMSLSNGSYDISLSDLWSTLLGRGTQPELELVIFELRLPRIIIGVLVGLGLGVAGAVIQSVSKNGLADPGILGINSGAGLAIVIYMFFFMGEYSLTGMYTALTMPIFGFVGGMVAAFLIFTLSWDRGRLDSQRLLLMGIAVGTGLGAVSLFLSLKMKSSDFDMATVWVTGSIWNANWSFILAMIPWFLILLPIIYMKARVLDVFQLQEESVKGLGVRTDKQKLTLLLLSVGLVAVCVSVSGSIGFVGLMAPHIARRLVGYKHVCILPISGLVGILLVVVSDYIAKTIVMPVEIPVGIVIAIIGVPYFIFLLLRERA